MGEEHRGEPVGEPSANRRPGCRKARYNRGGSPQPHKERGTLPTIKESGTVYIVWGDGTSSNQPAYQATSPNYSSIWRQRSPTSGSRSTLREKLAPKNADGRILLSLSRANEEQARTIGALETAQEPQNEPALH